MVHLRKRLAAYIRHKRAGVPQRLFARKTGVAQSTIMRIENEDQNVTLDTLEQLCKAFNVDVGDLFPAQPVSRAYKSGSRAVSIQPPMVHDSAVHDSAVHDARVQDSGEPTSATKTDSIKTGSRATKQHKPDSGH
jgi:transcriptional regulator with XRE-family HTH domain